MSKFISSMLAAFASGSAEGVSIAFFDLSFLVFVLSTIGYLLHLMRRTQTTWLVGFGALCVGSVTMTLALALRWIAAGWEHPPWTNLYESLVFFSWGMVLSYGVMEIKFRVKLVGAFVVPLVMIAMGMASLSGNKEITPLMPALQSVWLHFHVFGAAISYSLFIVAFAFAALYLYRDKLPLPYFHAAASFTNILALLAVTKGGVIAMKYPFIKSVVMNGKVYKDMVPGTDPPQWINMELPGLGTFAFLVFVLFVVATAINIVKRDATDPKSARMAMASHLFPTILLFVIVAQIAYQSSRYPGFMIQNNVYSFALVATSLFFSVAVLVLDSARGALMEALPKAKDLDNIAYKAIIVAFPLLSFVIISGAIWANNAWGRYWGWDPKETASLVTWIVYLLYLHTRITKGWMGRKTAYIAILGFGSVVFTYLGVNLVLSGLHSYATG